MMPLDDLNDTEDGSREKDLQNEKQVHMRSKEARFRKNIIKSKPPLMFPTCKNNTAA